MKKQHTILGYYHYKNCGDEALLAACKKVFDGCDVSYANPKKSEPLTGSVILGGGDIINPFFLNKVKEADDVKVFGAGLGYESEIELLEDCKVSSALFRNKKDVVLALSKGLDARYTPDIVFNLDAPEETSRAGRKKKLLGVMVADSISESYKQRDPSQIHYGNYLKHALAIALCDLREYYKVVFIPMCHARYQYDVKMMYEVLSHLPPQEVEHEIIEPGTSPQEVIRIVETLDVLATMRFHGLIFATLAGVPAINIGVTRKTQTYMEENSLQPLNIEPFSFTSQRFLEKIKVAEEPGTRGEMLKCRDENQKAAREAAAWVRENW
jgi:polysaccharide pyruvyl transferase WcaK-like protein